MKSEYPHSSVFLNNKEVLTSELMDGLCEGSSQFEQDVCAFLKAWLQGAETFSLHTSGSTGSPKEITIHRDRMIESARRTYTALQLNSSTRVWCCLDTRYIAGKMMLVRALVNGSPLAVSEPAANPFDRFDFDWAPDFASMVPLQLEATLATTESREKLNRITTLLVGGSPVGEALHSRLQNVSTKIFESYGMTETLTHIALRQLNGAHAENFFAPLPEIGIDIDERGCLVIQVPHLDRVVTNDLVEIRDHNKFQWLGRWDNIVNSGGVKISPEKVEHQVSQEFIRLNIDRNLFIAGIDDDHLGQRLILVVEGSAFEPDQVNEILTSLKASLPPYWPPKDVYFSPQFSRTETGKINRAATLQRVFRS